MSKVNVQNFPRPPLLQRISKHIRIVWSDVPVAETRDAYWVCETHHCPTYYLPPNAFSMPLTRTSKSSMCEWKGRATYYNIQNPQTKTTLTNKAWSYDSPTPAFKDIKGYVSLYASSEYAVFVDGEKVEPQPGDFYGGWITSEIEGTVKGGPGTWGW